MRVRKQTHELPDLIVGEHGSPGGHPGIPYAMLYEPEELRVSVVGPSFQELRRLGIKRLTVHAWITSGRAVASRAKFFVGTHRRFQIFFID